MADKKYLHYKQVKNPFPQFVAPKKKGSDEEKAT
ncbi:incFII family plasmid replication initiator RepA, partial [Salmonella enterica subsp. enterica serovar Give]|nr:incFII family plasmid replication initiator RepA [Salmonella enterica subsp. enterica serovar Give]